MDEKNKQYYKNKLLRERESVISFLDHLKDNEVTGVNVEMGAEISFYDNHPGDLASEMNDMERGMAFKEHEMTILGKIDDALKQVDDGTYGICKRCGKEIPKERLEFLPYAQHCVHCQNELSTRANENSIARPIEESVIEKPFGYGYNDYDNEDQIEYDAEDSYQDVAINERREKIYEFYEDDVDYVEPIEKISNEQYKSQLPD